MLVTLPPFIVAAAAEGLLTPFTATRDGAIAAENKDPAHHWYALVNNYVCFIYDSAALKAPPATLNELLEPRFKNKIQYSTPGQAGDGTAVMLLATHVFGGPDQGFAYEWSASMLHWHPQDGCREKDGGQAVWLVMVYSRQLP